MTGEAECLLATIRHTNAATSPSLDWHALLELAESHGLFMLFCRDFQGELPPEFISRQRTQWTTSALMAAELGRLLQEFSLRGIEVLPLKGPLLASLLYGSPSLRICDDLDLLVQGEDLPRAKSLLTDLGFTSLYPADDYHEAFQRRDTMVELHFAVAPPSSPAMDLKVAWARTKAVEFRGQTARWFAPPDLLMYLVIHGVKHEFTRMLWALDCSLALATLQEEEVDEVIGMARALGIEGALLTTCALAQLTFQVALPPRMADAIARKPEIPGQAAAILEKMLQGPAEATTTHQGAGLFLRLESSARARWLQRLRFLRPSHQDYAWAKSHKIHPRWLIFLRPLRLLKKHGPGAVWRLLFSRPATARCL